MVIQPKNVSPTLYSATSDDSGSTWTIFNQLVWSEVTIDRQQDYYTDPVSGWTEMIRQWCTVWAEDFPL